MIGDFLQTSPLISGNQTKPSSISSYDAENFEAHAAQMKMTTLNTMRKYPFGFMRTLTIKIEGYRFTRISTIDPWTIEDQ